MEKENSTPKEQSAIKQRIIEFAKARCHSVAEFERICGLSKCYVGCIRKSPSAEMYRKMTDAFPEMNLNWIMYGEGAMLKRMRTDNYGDANERTDGNDLLSHVLEEIKQLSETTRFQQQTIKIQSETILRQAESLNIILSNSMIIGPSVSPSPDIKK